MRKRFYARDREKERMRVWEREWEKDSVCNEGGSVWCKVNY